MKLFAEKQIKEWRALSQAALDNRLGPDWAGDPDSNVMQLARAVDRLLDERAKLVAVAKAAKTLGIDLVNRGAYDTIANSPENKLSDALAALEAE